MATNKTKKKMWRPIKKNNNFKIEAMELLLVAAAAKMLKMKEKLAILDS